MGFDGNRKLYNIKRIHQRIGCKGSDGGNNSKAVLFNTARIVRRSLTLSF